MPSGRVRCKFKVLLLQRQAEQQRDITYREVAAATGVPLATLARWASDEVERYSNDVLAAFCEYFGVGVGELLEYTPTQPGLPGMNGEKKRRAR